jgi:hypothetical protein
MPTVPVDVENLADYLLPFTDVVTDILDPARGNLRDGDKPLTATILIQRHKSYEVFHVLYGADNQF